MSKDPPSNIAQLPNEELEMLSGIMKAIAHPVRLRILCHLKNGRKNVSELEALLNMNQALVSQQLRLLRLNGLVTPARENGFVYYSIAKQKKATLDKIMKNLCGFRSGGP